MHVSTKKALSCDFLPCIKTRMFVLRSSMFSMSLLHSDIASLIIPFQGRGIVFLCCGSVP